VISTWDSVPNAIKTFENLTVRLLKEETLTKNFLEQDISDKALYSSRRSFNKSNVEGDSSTSFSNQRQNHD
jgi:hypothetical protein